MEPTYFPIYFQVTAFLIKTQRKLKKMPLLNCLDLDILTNLNFRFLEIAMLQYLEIATFRMKVINQDRFLMA